jgi:hypothetical protein
VIYCGTEEESDDVASVAWREAHLAYRVVLDLATDVQRNGHVISMVNFFTSVGLFHELALREIYATGTVRTNQIGLPLVCKNAIAFKNAPQGILEWRMHQLRRMSSIV